MIYYTQLNTWFFHTRYGSNAYLLLKAGIDFTGNYFYENRQKQK